MKNKFFLAIGTVALLAGCGNPASDKTEVVNRHAEGSLNVDPNGVGTFMPQSGNVDRSIFVGGVFTTVRFNCQDDSTSTTFSNKATTDTYMVPLCASAYVFPAEFETLSGRTFRLLAPTDSFEVTSTTGFSVVLQLWEVLEADDDGDGWADSIDLFPNDECSARSQNDLCITPPASDPGSNSVTDTTGEGGLGSDLNTEDPDGDLVYGAADTAPNDPCVPRQDDVVCTDPAPAPITDPANPTTTTILDWSQSNWVCDIANAGSCATGEVVDEERGERVIRATGDSPRVAPYLRQFQTTVTVADTQLQRLTGWVKPENGCLIEVEIGYAAYPYTGMAWEYYQIPLQGGIWNELLQDFNIYATPTQATELRIMFGDCEGFTFFDDVLLTLQ